jgi:hypothetical protein
MSCSDRAAPRPVPAGYPFVRYAFAGSLGVLLTLPSGRIEREIHALCDEHDSSDPHSAPH